MAAALGTSPDLLLMSPPRRAWFLDWKDTATGILGSLPWPCRVLEVPAMPTSLGGSSNEDRAIYLRVAELPVLIGATTVDVFPQILSGNLVGRVQARCYLATAFMRRPKAIGILSGTGLATPAFA